MLRKGTDVCICVVQYKSFLAVFFINKYLFIKTRCSTFELDASTGISSAALSHVRAHTHTFSHLDGRNSCRTPEEFIGGQGHLQGGPVPL